MKAGDRVICIYDSDWQSECGNVEGIGPKKDEITTIKRYYDGFIFYEYPDDGEGYNPEYFRKLDEEFAEEVLAKATEQQKVFKPHKVTLTIRSRQIVIITPAITEILR